MLRLTFFFIFSLQLASTGLLGEELCRLPYLVEHYGTHREEDADLKFLTFLWLHYGDSEHRESDSRHESLPLHCHGHAHLAEISYPQTPASHYTPDEVQVTEAPLRKGHSPFAFSWPVGYKGTLFQPPKV